jgi:hypothetical protein
MSCIDTPAVTNISRMSNSVNSDYLVPLNKGMYEPDCSSDCAIGIHTAQPIWDLLLAKWHWTIFQHITVVFTSKHHLPCAEYSLTY